MASTINYKIINSNPIHTTGPIGIEVFNWYRSCSGIQTLSVGESIVGTCDGGESITITICADLINCSNGQANFPILKTFFGSSALSNTVFLTLSPCWYAQVTYESDPTTYNLTLNIVTVFTCGGAISTLSTYMSAQRSGYSPAAANQCSVVETDSHIITICKK
jgi:hypothetical protein